MKFKRTIASPQLHVFFVLLLLMGLRVNGQDKRFEFAPTLGFVVHHEDLGYSFQEFTYGAHLGINMYNAQVKRFKSDLQVSLNTSGIANTSSNLITINGLYGGRYYILDPGKTTKVFVNALLGGAFVNETGDDFSESYLDVGYSAGIFVQTRRLLLGASAESFNNFVFKAGYTF